jgi:chaperonin GroEL
MSTSYAKVKSVSKAVEVKGGSLSNKVLSTMKTIADIVGSTLGPGGQPVLIERQEFGMPAMVTKDGVTVFRNLGFDDPVAHVIMETARDASVRTATEAGDGTTTATVLAEAIVRYSNSFVAKNPRYSPQKIVRKLESVFTTNIAPAINGLSTKADFNTPEGKEALRSVARVSANGDEALANAVIQCFELVGDDGNVTISEISGPSSYEVERIEGFPIGMGYEDSCGKFYGKFINDPGTQMCKMENPAFVCYHGRVTDIQTLIKFFSEIGSAWQTDGFRHNIVLVATGFSDTVLANLATNFAEIGSINVFPLLAPQNAVQGSELAFLQDVAAYTGATILDPLNKPFDVATLHDIGLQAKHFECGRFRSSVMCGHMPDGTPLNELTVLDRVDQLKSLLNQETSIYETAILNERIGKLTGGIAKLKVVGPSSGELREKRDRAEDAVAAVRGAIKHGTLPGGGWTLIKLHSELKALNDEVVDAVLRPALLAPVTRLLQNAGMSQDEINDTIHTVGNRITAGHEPSAYDALNFQYVDARSGGLLDSTPAVLEAIRNSISIAGLLGTLGGAVVFKRDAELERTEARETNQYLRDGGMIDPTNLD